MANIHQHQALWLNTTHAVLRALRGPGLGHLSLEGSLSPSALAALILSLSSEADQPPQLVIVDDDRTAQRLAEGFDFFSDTKSYHLLPSFDVSPYSGLFPNRRHICQRLKWLHRAQHARPGEIFIASAASLAQRTLPFDVLARAAQVVRVQSDLPKEFIRRLEDLGYSQVPLVEDVGTYSMRGGILDVFSSAYDFPMRMELFGDHIDSIRFFDPATQRSGDSLSTAEVLPAHEILFSDDNRLKAAARFRDSLKDRAVEDDDAQVLLQAIAQGRYAHGLEYLSAYFYEHPGLPLDHFSIPVTTWRLGPSDLLRTADQLHQTLKSEFDASVTSAIRPNPFEVYAPFELVAPPEGSRTIEVNRILIEDRPGAGPSDRVSFGTSDLKDFSAATKALHPQGRDLPEFLESKFDAWKALSSRIFLVTRTESQAQRLRVLLERTKYKAQLVSPNDYAWAQWLEDQARDPQLIHIVPRPLPESVKISAEDIVFMRDDDIFGRRSPIKKNERSVSTSIEAPSLQFGDLSPGDLVVHKLHGIGKFEGLTLMQIQGVDAELIQIRFRDNDKLYLPVYRIAMINKFSGPSSAHQLDKLGGTSWEKAKVKVRGHLRDLASELLKLYAARSQIERDPFPPPDDDYFAFEASFPYDETPDQQRAISDILHDLCERRQPMDRLVCGDVGFGKTEVALRAAFKVAQSGCQVAVIVPTTVLCFQHFETFQKRFREWPFRIATLNRFVSKKDSNQTLKQLAEGQVDIVIGTHRLLSRDVEFKKLGLLIIDEEQKFGVQHKEQLRKFRIQIDTMAMSATPIPRTLNLSLMGIRDLSLINTPPADRLPTRTFVTRFDTETIRRAIESEIARGGQVYFIHNRIESIYGLMDELRAMVPGVKMALGHGQMPEDQLEKVMISFFHGEVDVLVCTTIVESGMDVPRANTMFIDRSHQLGLSQLYQLRGRVGRSRERAYCYLLVPGNKRLDKDAQERLRVLQENSALGSGIRIAQHDLELRGSGDILGEDQSGHINSVGYEMYLDLLQEAIADARGEGRGVDLVEPEINLKIPALIPDKYIADIRTRLSVYRRMAEIASESDMDLIESDLRDQFGKLPPEVVNLMGLMLIRKICKDLSIKDLSGGKNGISLLFTAHTRLSTNRVIDLTARSNKKYLVSPDSRLHIRMQDITWPRVFDELSYLKSLL